MVAGGQHVGFPEVTDYRWKLFSALVRFVVLNPGLSFGITGTGHVPAFNIHVFKSV
jgi:hypothetical protein